LKFGPGNFLELVGNAAGMQQIHPDPARGVLERF
jgi:hypothetical protein